MYDVAAGISVVSGSFKVSALDVTMLNVVAVGRTFVKIGLSVVPAENVTLPSALMTPLVGRVALRFRFNVVPELNAALVTWMDCVSGIVSVDPETVRLALPVVVKPPVNVVPLRDTVLAPPPSAMLPVNVLFMSASELVPPVKLRLPVCVPPL